MQHSTHSCLTRLQNALFVLARHSSDTNPKTEEGRRCGEVRRRTEQSHPQGISASKMGDVPRVSHSIFDFQAPDVDLRNGDLRSALFEVLRTYHARGPVLSTELDDGKSCLFIFAGKDGGYVRPALSIENVFWKGRGTSPSLQSNCTRGKASYYLILVPCGHRSRNGRRSTSFSCWEFPLTPGCIPRVDSWADLISKLIGGMAGWGQQKRGD